MVDIVAPLNYERWAVLVSPLLLPDAQGEKPAAVSRHGRNARLGKPGGRQL